METSLAFNFREGYWGLEHLRLAICRRIFKMKPDCFMSRYKKPECVRTEICYDKDDKPALCERCGFVIMSAHFENGWRLDMCSALPVVSLDNPEFKSWLTRLSQKEDLLLQTEPNNL